MNAEMKAFKARLVNAMFNWRKGFDSLSNEHVIEATNNYGHFFITWDDSEDSFKVSINGDPLEDEFESLDEAKLCCLMFSRGAMMQETMCMFIIGLTVDKQHRAGKWSFETFAAMMSDQFFNESYPCTDVEIEKFVSYIEEASKTEEPCECERCQQIFGSGDEAAPDYYIPDTSTKTLH